MSLPRRSRGRRGVAAPLAAAAAAVALLAGAPGARADTTLRVYSAGGGDFSSVQAALDSVVDPAAAGRLTLLLAGVFRERVTVGARFTAGVDVVGTAPGGPLANFIVFNRSGSGGAACAPTGGGGTFDSWTLRVDAADVRLAGVAVANDACGYDHKAAGQSVALHVTGDRVAVFDSRLLGSQDTLYTGGARTYYARTFINGTVDALFGEGAAVWDACELVHNTTVTAHKGGVLPAAAGGGPTAYLLRDCSVDAYPGGRVVLGRPWGPTATVVWLNASLSSRVDRAGWDDWSHNCTAAPAHDRARTWCANVTYAEAASRGPGGAPGGRVWWSQQLDAAGAAAWTAARVLGAWQPAPPPAWLARARA